MRRIAIGLLSVMGLLAAEAVAAQAVAAQGRGLFSIGVLAGVAGAFESDGQRSFDHSASELVLAMRTGDRVWTSLRFGKIALDDEQLSIGRLDTDIEFIAIAGENRFRQAAYEFGVFVGLGRYQLDAKLEDNERESEEALGLGLGFTGDFDISRRFSFVAEIDVHYIFFKKSTFYGAALAGLAVHF